MGEAAMVELGRAILTTSRCVLAVVLPLHRLHLIDRMDGIALGAMIGIVVAVTSIRTGSR